MKIAVCSQRSLHPGATYGIGCEVDQDLEYSRRIKLDPIDAKVPKGVTGHKFHLDTGGLDLAFKHPESALNDLQRLSVYRCDLRILLDG
jgi:hypothetical protein